MKSFILGTALAAMILPAAAPALAQQGYSRGDRDDRGDNGRGRGDDRQNGRRDDRGGPRGNDRGNDRGRGGQDWQSYRNYDWNRPDQRYGGYDAARYYRDGNYSERRIGRNDRIYRGGNGRYYCRRTDGTTGLIVGGALGGLLGNSLANGRSSTVATLLGVGGGALLGQSIDRGNVRCR
ncbi:glycine zipper 2TM domain-containing protein [Sphingomonas sp. BIUV-7]|uniref:17 kDa surface antigen n=1 Tax=Sphingomonas natans TaxID=3063330 RepID=A0ABT8YEU1_9SPHN|nr:glycine zipper 2TM domain-containing protein [Sphingomonas sp. BIUV-7]MDO6416852.1 glycine zipper 2TM domain-containing protein [Sphingomonas sp. BIUV-7]